MWIRSQNKRSLVNAQFIDIRETRGGEREFYGDCGVTDNCTTGFFLGEYPTEEEALKVLGMIQELIQRTQHMWLYGKEDAYLEDAVFQMPQAGEVSE